MRGRYARQGPGVISHLCRLDQIKSEILQNPPPRHSLNLCRYFKSHSGTAPPYSQNENMSVRIMPVDAVGRGGPWRQGNPDCWTWQGEARQSHLPGSGWGAWWFPITEICLSGRRASRRLAAKSSKAPNGLDETRLAGMSKPQQIIGLARCACGATRQAVGGATRLRRSLAAKAGVVALLGRTLSPLPVCWLGERRAEAGTAVGSVPLLLHGRAASMAARSIASPGCGLNRVEPNRRLASAWGGRRHEDRAGPVRSRAVPEVAFRSESMRGSLAQGHMLYYDTNYNIQ